LRYLTPVAKSWRRACLADNAARQWLLIAVSHVVLCCVERSQNGSIAMHQQVWNIHC